MRVALAPREVAGFYSTLKRGFDEIGVPCDFVWLAEHRFGYSEGGGPFILRTARAMQTRFLEARSLLPRLFWAGAAAPWVFLVFIWSLLRFDAYVFALGESFLNLLELPLLRALGKRMVFVLHGSDVRLPYLNCSICRQTDDPRSLARKTKALKRRLKWIERYADAVVTHPIWSHLLEKPFVPFTRIGQTSPPAGYEGERSRAASESVRVLHAPSDPVCKGSAVIRDAIDQIRQQGAKVELIEIAGRPNKEVISEILKADIVVDQVLSDIRVAGLANEAMWLGTVVVVSGYAREALDSYSDCELIAPTVYCEPEELVEVLSRLVRDPAERKRLASETQSFARLNWAPRLMAERILRLIEGEIDEDWLCEPKRVDYVWGYGMPKERVAGIVGSIIRHVGTHALCVDDKPHLVRRFCEMAGTTPAAVDPGSR